MEDDQTRRRLLASTGGLTAAALAGCFGSENNGGSDGGDGGSGGDGGGGGGGEEDEPATWPTYGYDFQNTVHVDTTGPQDGIELAWSTEVDEGEFHDAPVMADGTLYWTSDVATRAVDSDTGEMEWTTEVPADQGMTPVVQDGTLYVLSDETITALDAATGDERWAHEYEKRTHFRVEPVAYDGSIYVVAEYRTGSEHYYPVFEFDPDTGEYEELFRYTFEEHGVTNLEIQSKPALSDGTLFFIGYGKLFAADLDAGEGEVLFEAVGDMNRNPPVADDGTVYVSDQSGRDTDSHVIAVDAESGEEQWRFTDEFTSQVSVATDGDTVFATPYDHLYAIDAETGEERWAVELDSGIDQKVTITDGVVYVNRSDTIWGIDAASGDIRWEYDHDGRYLHGVPVVVLDGAIYAHSARRGKAAELFAFESP